MNLNLAAQALDAYLAADIPAFLWGPPGVGKSSIIHQNAGGRGWQVIDFRCSTRDPVALTRLRWLWCCAGASSAEEPTVRSNAST